MIALASDCLLFRTGAGETVPYSAEMVSGELTGVSVEMFDPEFVNHAANAVFHYFKHELGRHTVSLGEFAGALENVLRGFAVTARSASVAESRPEPPESDLSELARESGPGGDLFFFPRLRAELRQRIQQLNHGLRVLRFHGLRECVMELAGARHWSPRCRSLEEHIVNYLRECLSAETGHAEFALIVE
jgi:hypothetical protein